MKKAITFSVFMFLMSAVALAAEETTSSGGGIDWVQLIFAGGYLLGVFVLLPWVIYTNMNEGLFKPDENPDKVQPREDLSMEERNDRAAEILERIGEKLTEVKGENDEDLITITNGGQAKFMRRGLNYINKKLVPDDQEIIDRVNEFAEVYKDRNERVFTGSNWVIGCAIAVGVLFLLTGGITTFIFIHILGIVFYVLSSRTTMYGLEKRLKYFGRSSGAFGRIMQSIFVGNGTKYYRKRGGSWQRDWETEGNMAIISLIIMFIVAIILGSFAAFLGVINFFLNYSQSYLHPFKTDDKWYEEYFGNQAEAA